VQQLVLDLIAQGQAAEYEPVSAEIRVIKEAGGDWTLQMQTVQGGHNGERSLRADSCEILAKSAALIIAMMLDPELLPEMPDIIPPAPNEPEAAPFFEPKPPVAPQVSTSVPSVPEMNTEPASRRTLEPRPHVYLEALLDIGSLPTPMGGVGMGGGVRLSGFDFGGSVEMILPSTGSTETAEASGRLWLLAGRVRVAWMWTRSRASLGPYGEFLLGVIHGQGLDVADPRSVNVLHCAVGGGAATRMRITETFYLGMDLGLVANLNRKRFVIDDIGSIHDTPPVTVRMGLMIFWVFQ
jgi:hypothetical protein